MRTRHGLALPVVLAGLLCAGCGAGGIEDGARSAALDFLAAEHEPARECALLAPGTVEQLSQDSTCEDEVAGVDLGDGRIESAYVAGHSAQVVTDAGTLFLALFDTGWRVTAAGCHPVDDDPAIPYECAIGGS